MIFLANENIPLKSIEILREKGFDIKSVNCLLITLEYSSTEKILTRLRKGCILFRVAGWPVSRFRCSAHEHIQKALTERANENADKTIDKELTESADKEH